VSPILKHILAESATRTWVRGFARSRFGEVDCPVKAAIVPESATTALEDCISVVGRPASGPRLISAWQNRVQWLSNPFRTDFSESVLSFCLRLKGYVSRTIASAEVFPGTAIRVAPGMQDL